MEPSLKNNGQNDLELDNGIPSIPGPATIVDLLWSIFKRLEGSNTAIQIQETSPNLK